jgi:hypothetical protein
MFRIELEAVIDYEMTEYAKKYNLDRSELENNLKSWILRQNGIDILGSAYQDSDEYIYGFRDGYKEAEESLETYFPSCPK